MVASNDNQDRIPRAIEVGFPIVEINRLAQPERSSFKPIYQMHKWFARRASCVFRAILLGALKPAWKADGTPTDLMEEFYRNHGDDPETAGKVVLDPFMGGGTTVVEALRLGCRVIGIDLNPVAWFVVKTEIEPVDLDALQDAFERLAARPVTWNDDKPLRETLLGRYRTTVAPDVEADVIYTFWVKHAICTDPTCKREVPLFKDYLVAHKALSVRYHRDVLCPRCKKRFDWEIEPALLIADTAMMVNSPRGSAGEGRPHQLWTYAPEPAKPKGRVRRVPTLVSVYCPCCNDDVRPELAAIEAGRYGNQPLPEPDVRLVCIGKCLELYSAHYNCVLDHEGNPLPLHRALQDIGAIIDQLVTRARPLPSELEDIDALSYAWLRLLMPVRGEVGVDKVNKGLRAMQVNTEDLKKAGLIIRGRTGRGRTYEVKQPLDRLEDVGKRLRKAYERPAQGVLFQDGPGLATAAVPLVDLLHALIALAEAGEPIWPWIERFPERQGQLRAAFRFLKDERADWAGAIDRVLAVIEGAPLFNRTVVA